MGSEQKPVFVTGATGSIGYALAKRLSENGSLVRALARDPSRAGNLKALAGVEVVASDLSQLGSLRGLVAGCSVVYHVAAKIMGSDPALYRTVNVDGTTALLEEAIRARVERFVHVSTTGVYGFVQAENITEDAPGLRVPFYTSPPSGRLRKLSGGWRIRFRWRLPALETSLAQSSTPGRC
jgi:nucleoside-diphosphate-sugar epimerase